MDEEQLQLLFDHYAKSKGFTDFNEFKGLMQDSASRKVFFDDSNKELGFKDYNDFENTVKKKADSKSIATPLDNGLSNTPTDNTEIPTVDLGAEKTDEKLPDPTKNPIDLAADFDQLSKATKVEQNGSMGIGGGSMTEVPDEGKTINSEGSFYKVGGTKEAGDLKEFLKIEHGITDPEKLHEEQKDFPQEAYNWKNENGETPYSKENQLLLREKNPVEYLDKINGVKTQYEIYKKTGNWGIANKFINLKRAYSFDELVNNFQKQKDIIQSVFDTNEDITKANERLYKSQSYAINPQAYGFKESYDKSGLSNLLSPYQYVGLETLKVFEPEKYEQYLFILQNKSNPKNELSRSVSFGKDGFTMGDVKESETTESIDKRKGLEKVNKELYDIGRNNSILSAQKSNAEIESKFENATPEEQQQLKEQYLDNNNTIDLIKADAKKDDERYPISAQMKFDDQLKESIGQANMTPAQYLIYHFGKGLNKTGQTSEDILTGVFGSKSDNAQLQAQRLGEMQTESSDAYLPENLRSSKSAIIPKFSKELQSSIDGIIKGKNINDLSEVEQNELTKLLSDNQDKIDYVTNTGKGQNFISKSTLYTMAGFTGDIGSFLVQMGGLKALGLANKPAELVTLWNSGYSEGYNKATAEGMTPSKANQMGFLHGGIMTLAGTVSSKYETAMNMLKGAKSPLSKEIAGVSKEVWDNIVRGNKGTINKIAEATKNVIGENAKNIATFGGLVPAAGDIGENIFFEKNHSAKEISDNIAESMKQMAIGSGALAGVGFINHAMRIPASFKDKAMIWESGSNPDITKARINESIAKGTLTETEAKSYKKAVDNISGLIKKVPTENSKRKPLTDKQKIEYLYNSLFKQKAAEAASDLPPKQSEEALKNVMVADFKNEQIIDPNTKSGNESRLNAINKKLEQKDEDGKLIITGQEKLALEAEKEAIESIIKETAKGNPEDIQQPIELSTEPGKLTPDGQPVSETQLHSPEPIELLDENGNVVKTVSPPPIEVTTVSGNSGEGQQASNSIGSVKQQMKEFGVSEKDVDATHGLLSQVFGGLKKAGLTAAKTVGDWVGIGKGDEKPYSLKIDGKEVQVQNVHPEVINGFYSPIEKKLLETKVERQSANKWLTSGLIGKGDEATFTGVKEWLESKNPQEQVSKSDILQHMKDNRIQIVEVVKGGFDDGDIASWWNDEGGANEEVDFYDLSESEKREARARYQDEIGDYDGTETKFSQYQFTGDKTGYKEVLITMPTPPETKAETYSVKEENGKYYAVNDRTGEKLIGNKYTKEESQQQAEQMTARWALNGGRTETAKFKSSHFDEPNILAHLRMNTRTDAEGKKVVFLEEVQSDWGQKGKKEGFKLSEEEAGQQWKDADKKYADFMKRMESKYGKEWMDELDKSEVDEETKLLDARENTKGGTIPKSPFVTDTNAWTKLGLKYALQHAVKEGAEKIAWSTGTQQFERWGSEEIHWRKQDGRTPAEEKRMQELGEKIVNYKDTADERIEHEKLARKEGGWGVIINEQTSGATAFNGRETGNKEDLTITSKAELREAINRSLKRERNDAEIDKLTDRIWNRMQTEDSGTSLPRKEGMEAFYGSPEQGKEGIVGSVAKALVKELTGKEGKIGETKIKTGEGEDTYSIITKDGRDIGGGWTKEKAEKWVSTEGRNPNYYTIKIENDASRQSTQHSIEITPELKAVVEGKGQPLFKDAEAQYRVESGKNIIEAIKDFNGSPRATVALTHEIMHPTVVSIIDGAKEGNEVGVKHTKTIVDEFNKANPNNKVTVEDLIKGNDTFKEGTTSKQYRQVQEFIAKAWEKYHREGGKGFSESFQKVLDTITEAFKSVYKSISGKQLTPELRKMFDDILGKENTQPKAQASNSIGSEPKGEASTQSKAVSSEGSGEPKANESTIKIDEEKDTHLVDGIANVSKNKIAGQLLKVAFDRGVIPEKLYNDFGKELSEIDLSGKSKKAKDEALTKVAEVIGKYVDNKSEKTEKFIKEQNQLIDNAEFEQRAYEGMTEQQKFEAKIEDKAATSGKLEPKELEFVNDTYFKPKGYEYNENFDLVKAKEKTFSKQITETNTPNENIQRPNPEGLEGDIKGNERITPKAEIKPEAAVVEEGSGAEPPGGKVADKDLYDNTLSGIKNKKVDSFRKQNGMQPITAKFKQTYGETFDKVLEHIDDNENFLPDLVAALKNGEPTIKGKDGKLVPIRQVTAAINYNEALLNTEYHKALKSVEEARASNNNKDVINAELKLGQIVDQLDANHEAARFSGNDTAAGLSLRQFLLDESYNAVRIQQEMNTAFHGKDNIPEHIQKQIDNSIAKIQELQVKLDEANETIKKQNAQKAVDKETKKQRQQKLTPKAAKAVADSFRSTADRVRNSDLLDKFFGDKNSGLTKLGFSVDVKEAVAKSLEKIATSIEKAGRMTNELLTAAKELATKFKDHTEQEFKDLLGKVFIETMPDEAKGKVNEKLNSIKEKAKTNDTEYLISNDMTADIRGIVKEYVANGLNDAETIVNDIHDGLKNNIAGLTIADVREAISGEGRFKEPTKDDLLKQYNSVKKVIGLTQRLENLKNGKEHLKLIDKAAKEEAIKQLEAAIDKESRIAKVGKYSDEEKNEVAQASYTKKINDIREQIKTGNFSTEKSEPYKRNQRTNELQLELQNEKNKLKAIKDKQDLKNMPTSERIVRWVTDNMRGAIVAFAMPKLTAAAIMKVVNEAPLELSRRATRPFVRKGIRDKALVEGGASSTEMANKSMAGYYGSFTNRHIFKEVAHEFLYGKTDWSKVTMPDAGEYGYTPDMAKYIYRSHQAIKYIPKKAAFERAFILAMDKLSQTEGVDINSPITLEIALKTAKDYAMRDIFMGNHEIIDRYKRVVGDMKRVDGNIDKVKYFVKSFVFPVVTVPVNYAAERVSYLPGVGWLAANRKTLFKSLDKITPEQADYLIRNLSRHNLGAFYFGLGLFAYSAGKASSAIWDDTKKGGYGELRGDKTLKPRDLKLGDNTVPHTYTHGVTAQSVMDGATFGQIVDENKKIKNEGLMNYLDAAFSLFNNVANDVPFYSDAKKFNKWLSRKDKLENTKEYIANRIVPSQIGNMTDKDENGNSVKRDVHGFVEQLENNSGINRKTLPNNGITYTPAAKKMLTDYNIDTDKPERTYKKNGEDVAMTNDEYKIFLNRTSERINNALDQLSQKGVNDKEYIKSVISYEKEAAKHEFEKSVGGGGAKKQEPQGVIGGYKTLPIEEKIN